MITSTHRGAVLRNSSLKYGGRKEEKEKGETRGWEGCILENKRVGVDKREAKKRNRVWVSAKPEIKENMKGRGGGVTIGEWALGSWRGEQSPVEA